MKDWAYLRRKLKRIRTWHLVASLVVLVFLALVCVKINHAQMQHLKQAVVQADKAEDAELANREASKLHRYVSRHMGTTTGQIALQHLYDAEAQTSTVEGGLPNPALYQLSYAAPLVSFDLAGVFTVLSCVVFLSIALKLSTEVVLGWIVKHKR
jgi:hypothetical protein